jgi:hypothetical protein
MNDSPLDYQEVTHLHLDCQEEQARNFSQERQNDSNENRLRA